VLLSKLKNLILILIFFFACNSSEKIEINPLIGIWNQSDYFYETKVTIQDSVIHEFAGQLDSLGNLYPNFDYIFVDVDTLLNSNKEELLILYKEGSYNLIYPTNENNFTNVSGEWFYQNNILTLNNSIEVFTYNFEINENELTLTDVNNIIPIKKFIKE